MTSGTREERLLQAIAHAWAGVTLGGGVSLHETHVIDAYGSDEERRVARADDEKLDWKKLVDDPDLLRFFAVGAAGLCFLDAEGVRFYLPACLTRIVRDLRNWKDGKAAREWDLLEAVFYHLCDGLNRDRFSILDEEQRRCVWDFLVYLHESGDDDPSLISAIHGFWKPNR